MTEQKTVKEGIDEIRIRHGEHAREFTHNDAGTVERTAKTLWQRARDKIAQNAGAIAADMARAEGVVAWIQRPDDFDAVDEGDIARARRGLVTVRTRLESMFQFFRGFEDLFADMDDRETLFVLSIVEETSRRAFWLDHMMAEYEKAEAAKPRPFLRVTVDGMDCTPATLVAAEDVPEFTALADGTLDGAPYSFGSIRLGDAERLYFNEAGAWYFVKAPAGIVDRPHVVVERGRQ